MSESKAVEDYKIFESLRNRFSDATSPPPRPEPRKASKRRFDPRNAPPLVPLIEEGDQLQEAMVISFQLLMHTSMISADKIRGGAGVQLARSKGGAGLVALLRAAHTNIFHTTFFFLVVIKPFDYAPVYRYREVHRLLG